MASKRKKGERWEFTVKRAGLLEKPLYLTFATEEEGDEYCRRLEALLDRGIVPTEHQVEPRVLTLGQLIHHYIREAHPAQKDREILATVAKAKGKAPLVGIDAAWVDGWVTEMKRVNKYAPATLRAKIGATARCCDWAVRKKLVVLPDHPFRTLPDGYSIYTPDDAALAGGRREDVSRERRLEPGEEERLFSVIAAGVLPRKQRPYPIPHRDDFAALVRLALETAMRLRELYTMEPHQISLERRTVYLDRTKNGDSRQVPLSSVALVTLREQMGRAGEARVFPWWDGRRTEAGLKKCSNFLSKLFVSVADAAGCDDLGFHDLRHEATSRFFERTSLSGEEIMKITGHKDHRMVMRYFNLRASNLVDRLW